MMNGLTSELYKLFHARIFWVLVLISIALSLLTTGLIFLEEKGWLTEQVTVETGESSLKGFDMLIESVLEPSTFFVYLFAALVASFFISSEYSNGTIKNIVSTGYKRHTVYTSKFIVVWFATITVLVCMVVTFALFSSMFFGFGAFPSGSAWLMAGRAFGYTCLLIGAFSAITTFISMHARSSAIALFSTLGFFLVFGSAIELLAQQYTLFEQLSRFSVFRYMSQLPISVPGNSSLDWQLTRTAVITIVLFYVGGMYLFKRKDIQ